jgi:hypothetical protein
VKKLFMKPPAMIELFKINVPDTGSPERTQWGTWLDSIVYYAENFQIVCSALTELDSFLYVLQCCKNYLVKTDLRHYK